MSEVDRMKLLRRLSQSTTPLWLTENPRPGDNEVDRAADWLSSLGYSARNGFSVHFRELLEEEMYEPTLVRDSHFKFTYNLASCCTLKRLLVLCQKCAIQYEKFY